VGPVIYTIGYGGRHPDDVIALLKANGIETVVDVRLRPDRASLGSFVKARTPDKGIEALLASAAIAYRSLVELGNVFIDCADWRDRYRRLLEDAGGLLTERLLDTPCPACLLCAEKAPADCHRKLIGDYLAMHGHQVKHIA